MAFPGSEGTHPTGHEEWDLPPALPPPGVPGESGGFW